jgi:hypothetical protein
MYAIDLRPKLPMRQRIQRAVCEYMANAIYMWCYRRICTMIDRVPCVYRHGHDMRAIRDEMHIHCVTSTQAIRYYTMVRAHYYTHLSKRS